VESFSDANEAGSAASSTRYISLESIFGSEQFYWEDLGDEFGGVYQREDGSWSNSYYKSYYDRFFVAANSSASYSFPLHVEGNR
jgi:hypothetical protein